MRKFDLSSMTWPEVEEALRKSDIAIIPVGALEEHGPHIPIDADNFTASKVIAKAVQKVGDDVAPVVAPLIPYGLSKQYMGFPGTITLEPETLTKITIDVGKSLIHHGFKKIAIITSHSGNLTALEHAARFLTDETGAFVTVVSIWRLGTAKGMLSLRKSEPGGIGHACEHETAFNLALRPNEVKMELAKDELPEILRKEWFYFDPDLKLGPKVSWFWDLKELGGKSGVIGYATKATKEVGEKTFEIVVDVIADFLRALKEVEVK